MLTTPSYAHTNPLEVCRTKGVRTRGQSCSRVASQCWHIHSPASCHAQSAKDLSRALTGREAQNLLALHRVAPASTAMSVLTTHKIQTLVMVTCCCDNNQLTSREDSAGCWKEGHHGNIHLLRGEGSVGLQSSSTGERACQLYSTCPWPMSPACKPNLVLAMFGTTLLSLF